MGEVWGILTKEIPSLTAVCLYLLLGFMAISWKMTGAQLAFYDFPISGPVSILEVDVGSVSDGIWVSLV